MRAAGIPPMSTVALPFMIASGGPAHTAGVPRVAAGIPPMSTLGTPGPAMGPPTCGCGPFETGQVCKSPTRAAGGINCFQLMVTRAPLTVTFVLPLRVSIGPEISAPAGVSFRLVGPQLISMPAGDIEILLMPASSVI